MSSGRRRQLTTTSYALLGLLAIGPMSAYELTKQAVHTIGLVAAHAESGMYAELQRLEAGGLVTSEATWVGRRRRTEYRITDDGRHAIEAWLSAGDQQGRPDLDFPAMVRVLFAEQGQLDDLRATLERVRLDAASTRQVGVAMAQPYIDGTGAFPARSHVNVLVWRFLLDFHGMVESWAAWALDQTSSWTGTGDDAAKRAAAVEVWREATSRYEQEKEKATAAASAGP